MVDGAKPIELPSGASVTLLAQSGKTIALNGPYEGVPDASAQTGGNELVETVSELFADGAAGSELAV